MESDDQDLEFVRTAILERLVTDKRDGTLGDPASYHHLWPSYETLVDLEHRRLTTPEDFQHEPEATPHGTVDRAQFGRFRDLEPIGRGGQGTVYRAIDEQLGRTVAVKILDGVQALRGDALERFLREARLAANLDHDAICTVYDSGVVGNVPFIAMQYIEGDNLAARIGEWRRDGELSPRNSAEEAQRVRTVVEWGAQIAAALAHAHSRGVLHRDIKPSNVLLRADGRVFLTDFGLARPRYDESRALTATGAVLGTASYLAPEGFDSDVRIDTERDADLRSDIYSLGVTLYELVTLSRPFDTGNYFDTASAIRTGIYVGARRANRAVSRDLATVIATAMERDPARRFSSAEDLVEELRRVLASESVKSRPLSRLVRTQRWLVRNRTLAIAGSITAGALVVGLLQSLSSLQESRARSRDLLVSLSLLHEAPASYLRLDRTVDNLRTWIDQAEELVQLRSSYVQQRDALRNDRGTRVPPTDLPSVQKDLARLARIEEELSLHPEHAAELEHELELAKARVDSAEPQYVFDSERDESHHRQLSAMIQNIDKLADDGSSMISGRSVRRRLALWRQAEAALHRENASLWRDFAARVAGDEQLSRMQPVRDLVPLDRDPASGFEEFALIGTGDVPVRSADGILSISEHTAIVLVLLPGAECRLGRLQGDLVRERHTPWAAVLEPFLIGKYEVTRGQWSKCFPSDLQGELAERLDHPIQTVSYWQAEQYCECNGLNLPTEAQWEYACRGQQATALYSWGESYLDSVRYANVAGEENTATNDGGNAPWDDGHVLTAPVGSFLPNDFGLFDMQGNVSEWCRDEWSEVRRELRAPSDGLALVAPRGENRAYRGTSYYNGLYRPYTHWRTYSARVTAQPVLGLRVTRLIR